MADGTRKPIEQIKIGDLVIATDQLTGQTTAFAVTDLIAGLGAKQLVAIAADGVTSTATLEHPLLARRLRCF